MISQCLIRLCFFSILIYFQLSGYLLIYTAIKFRIHNHTRFLLHTKNQADAPRSLSTQNMLSYKTAQFDFHAQRYHDKNIIEHMLCAAIYIITFPYKTQHQDI